MVHVLLLLFSAAQQQGFPETVPPLEPKPTKQVQTAPSTPANPASPATDKDMHIVVDLKKQRVIAMEGEKEIYNLHCSTGRHNRTPEGTFSVRQKARYNKALPKYGSVPIPYSLKLDIVKGGRRVYIAIHAFKSVPSYPASHGCIRLRYGDAKKLFEWAEAGIPVTITHDVSALKATPTASQP